MLTNFYNKLFSSPSLEKFLSVLYKETNARFKIRSLVLSFESHLEGTLQYVCQSKGIYKQFNSKNLQWENLTEIKLKDESCKKYLANALGRTVQNLLTLTIKLKQYEKGRADLFVEFFAKKTDKLLNFYTHLDPMISTGVDFLLLTHLSEKEVKLWATSFNELKEPLAIFDEKGELIKSNAMFNKIKELDKLSSLPETTHWEQKTFKKNNYLVSKKEGEYTICHYVDMTESLNLKKQLIQNTKMSALGDLGEDVTQKLSNPLTGVLSMAKLFLKENKISKDLKQDMEDVVEGISRSQDIISDLLKFSRSSTNLSHADLNEAVKKTLPFLKSVVGFSNFQLKLFEKKLMVNIQVGLFQQVVFNLVKNACEAVSEIKETKHRQVRVLTRKKEDQAILYVEDSGKGVETKDYNNIFKAFFTTKKKGTGLGLNMSKNIVETFNGTIKLERSSLGGASFKVFLPLVTNQ